jgi:VanZ family protein
MILSIVGFMIKLPSSFRHIDKELHALFYFSAAAFINILYANKKIIKHLVIFLLLFLFGVMIEYTQEYSNTLFHIKIHGRFDLEDVQANLKGLILFSLMWLFFSSILYVNNKFKKDD